MVLAACASRSSTRPQAGQTGVRTQRLVWIRAPPPEQSWRVDAGVTASTRVPAHAVLPGRRGETGRRATRRPECASRVQTRRAAGSGVWGAASAIGHRDATAAQGGRLNGRDVHERLLAHAGTGRLVGHSLALSPDLLMRLGARVRVLRLPLAARLAARDALVGVLARPVGCAVGCAVVSGGGARRVPPRR